MITRGWVFLQLVGFPSMQGKRKEKEKKKKDSRRRSPQLQRIIPKIKSVLSQCSHFTLWLPEPKHWDDRRFPKSHLPAFPNSVALRRAPTLRCSQRCLQHRANARTVPLPLTGNSAQGAAHQRGRRDSGRSKGNPGPGWQWGTE